MGLGSRDKGATPWGLSLHQEEFPGQGQQEWGSCVHGEQGMFFHTEGKPAYQHELASTGTLGWQAGGENTRLRSAPGTQGEEPCRRRRGSSRCLTSTSFHSPRPKAGKWEIPEPEAGGCRPGMVTPHAAWPCAQRTRLPPAALAPHSCPHRHEAPAQALPCTGPRGRPPPQLTPPGDRPPGDSHSPGRPPTSLHTAPGLPPPSLLSPAARPRPRHRLSRKPGDGAPSKAKDETWTFSAPTEAGL